MPNGFPRPAFAVGAPANKAEKQYKKSKGGGSARAKRNKPERRMSIGAYARALKRMTAQAVDSSMKAYSKNYKRIKDLMDTVDGYVTLPDGSKVSTHAKQFAEGVVRDGITHVQRRCTSKGSTETAAGADAITAPTTANLFGSQRALPVGSTITETCRIGRPAVPKGRGFNPIKMVIYKSDQKPSLGSATTLVKAPAFRADTVGINEIYSKLVPLEPSELQMRRISIMHQPNWVSSKSPSEDRVKNMWDTPLESSAYDGETSDVPGARTSYFPYDMLAKLRYVNLNEVLTSSIRITLVQMKGPNTYGRLTDAAQTYFPWEELNIALAAMPDAAKINATATTHLANAYAGTNSGEGSQYAYGYTSTEFNSKIGSYDFKARKSIKSSPRFKESFHEVYNTGWINVGAGSVFEQNLTHHINRNFSSLGNYSEIKAGNSWTAPAVFMLCEVKGRKDTEYYECAKGIEPLHPALERTFSSGTGPVTFGWEFESAIEFTSVDQPVTQNVEANVVGLPYKKSYIKVENEINVSEIVNQPFGTIVASEAQVPEPTTAEPLSTRIIVPVVKSSNIQGSQVRGVKT